MCCQLTYQLPVCLFTHLSPASATLAISLKNYSSLQDCWFHQIIIFAGSWWQSRVSFLRFTFWKSTLTLKFPLHRASSLESATRSDRGKRKFPHHNFHFDSGTSRKWLETSKCDRLLPSFIVAAGILPSFPTFFPSTSSFSRSVQIWFFSVTKAEAALKLRRTTSHSPLLPNTAASCESTFMMLFQLSGVKFRLQCNE